jgi:hypothetical protein
MQLIFFQRHLESGCAHDTELITGSSSPVLKRKFCYRVFGKMYSRFSAKIQNIIKIQKVYAKFLLFIEVFAKIIIYAFIFAKM